MSPGPHRPRHELGRKASPTTSTAVSPVFRCVENGQMTERPEVTTANEALTYAAAGTHRMALSLYPAPTHEDIHALIAAWQLHPVLADDLLHARQRPKLERYGDVVFLVLRSARYIDESEEVEFSEFHILMRPNALAVLCQDRRWIDGTRGEALEASVAEGIAGGTRTALADDARLGLGPEAVLYRLLDEMVDGYQPVLQGLGIDKEQVERQVFSGDAAVAERIYRLSQEVIDMQHATMAMLEVVRGIRSGFEKYNVPEQLQAYLQDVLDHLKRANVQIGEYREALSQILSVNATLVAQRQNEDMKKISGWAAILFAPTLIGAIYGMNFDHMPELHWAFGYPAALIVMLGFTVTLFVVFKRRNWF
ncbi:magnesium and cobalt transport protein CorA [Glutamicibacter endophyticus]